MRAPISAYSRSPVVRWSWPEALKIRQYAWVTPDAERVAWLRVSTGRIGSRPMYELVGSTDGVAVRPMRAAIFLSFGLALLFARKWTFSPGSTVIEFSSNGRFDRFVVFDQAGQRVTVLPEHPERTRRLRAVLTRAGFSVREV